MLVPGMYLADRYEVLEKIGSGGMADVYKAKCHKLNRLVAIKVLKNQYSSDANFVKKFRIEAQSAAGLSHPNIVSVYDVGSENGIHFIVMELVQGITLKNYIDMKGKLEVREALNISIQIASGLSAAHQNRIIHRDVKPQNIIMSRDGKVKVTDFGIAKVADSTTVTNTAAGSVHYISPEQARGGYSDAKSDIYSLGITMYEMLTGRIPFDGESNVAVALLHIQGEMIPPRQIDPAIPRSYEKIILKCTQKKPDRRYASAKELIADLRRVLSNPDGAYVNLAGVTADMQTVVMSDQEISSMYQNTNAGRYSNTNSGMYQNGNSGMYQGRNVQNTAEMRRQEELQRQRLQALDQRRYDDDEDDEDDENDEVNPGLEKVMIVMGIIGAIILVIAICFIIGRTVGLFGNNGLGGNQSEPQTESQNETEPPVQISMISLKFMTEAEAANKLREAGITEEAGFRITFSQRASEENNDEGLVIDQDPVEGTMLSAGALVTVYISSGKETFTLDGFAGLTLEQAKNKLGANGLTLTDINYEEDSTVREGLVIRTLPEEGSEVSAGDGIVLVISSGRGITNMPSIIGITEAEAKQRVEEAGLVFATEQGYSEDVAKGNVIGFTVDNQTIQEGAEISKGATVMATISAGSEFEGKMVNEVRNLDPRLYDEALAQGTPMTGTLEVRLQSTNEIIYTNSDFNSDTYEPIQRTITGLYGTSDELIYYLNGSRVHSEVVQFDGR